MVAVDTEKEKPDKGRSVIDEECLFTIEVLKIITDAQQQHGLRHGDYQRYRGYCTRRIHRLRKILNLMQGDRRHFRKKVVTEAHLTNEKAILIPLMETERAWSHAMQLRPETNTEPRKKFRLISRLSKAVKTSLHLQQLCEHVIFDGRTRLEVEAYVAWIRGTLFFEQKRWQEAMTNFKRAQVVYETLSSAINEDDAILYRQKCEELSPNIRYCAYNLGAGGAVDIEQLMELRTVAHGDLLENINLLMAETKKGKDQACGDIVWRGKNVTAKSPKVQAFLLSDADLDKTLGTDAAKNVELLEQNLMDCKDAISVTRDEIKSENATKSKVGTTGNVAGSSAQTLLTYLSHVKLSRTIDRTLMMCRALRQNPVANEKNKVSKDQELTRLYEIIIQNLEEMVELEGVPNEEPYRHEIRAKINAFKTLRCYYIGRSLASVKRYVVAYAIYEKADAYLKETLRDDNILDKSTRDELNFVVEGLEADKYRAQANEVLLGAEGSVTNTKHAKKPSLIKRLDEYYEDPSLVTKMPNVVAMPPDMVPVPCKPMFFDVAFNKLKFPPLDDKINAGKEQATRSIGGFVKGLWGWGKK